MGKLPMFWVTGCADTVGVVLLSAKLGSRKAGLAGTGCLVRGFVIGV